MSRLIRCFLGSAPPTQLVKALLNLEWHQNVRELKSVLRGITVTSHEEAIQQHEKLLVDQVVMSIEGGRPCSLKEMLQAIERGIIERAWYREAGNQARAAMLLGITDRTIRRHLAKLRLL